MTDYFYIDSNGQQQGPISPLCFTALGITATTFVWCNGMTDWKRAGELPELHLYLDRNNESKEEKSISGSTTPPRFNHGEEKPNPYAHHKEYNSSNDKGNNFQQEYKLRRLFLWQASMSQHPFSSCHYLHCDMGCGMLFSSRNDCKHHSHCKGEQCGNTFPRRRLYGRLTTIEKRT